jgi:hypothetical protein
MLKSYTSQKARSATTLAAISLKRSGILYRNGVDLPTTGFSASSEIPELSAMLFARIWRTRGGKHESGIHYTGNQARDFKIESGIASARRWSEKDDTAQNIGGRQEKNRSRATGQVGESQGSNEVTPSLFPD